MLSRLTTSTPHDDRLEYCSYSTWPHLRVRSPNPKVPCMSTIYWNRCTFTTHANVSPPPILTTLTTDFMRTKFFIKSLPILLPTPNSPLGHILATNTRNNQIPIKSTLLDLISGLHLKLNHIRGDRSKVFTSFGSKRCGSGLLGEVTRHLDTRVGDAEGARLRTSFR